MQYMLLIYADETGWQNLTPAEQESGMAAYHAFAEAMTKAGVLKGSNRLGPISTATTVRVVDGKNKVMDGPYAELKEQLGGYFMIDVPDLDAAISWAVALPGGRSWRGRGPAGVESAVVGTGLAAAFHWLLSDPGPVTQFTRSVG